MSLLDPNARATGQASARLRNKVSAHPRQSSGVYNTFSAKQISGLREAFGTIDTDSDGFITRRDLDAMLGNLGQANEGGKASAALMQSALKDGEGATEKVNFTQFLTMFGEHLSELDEASDLVAAFECFDERDEGKIDAGELRYWLGEVGDRMQDEEIDRLLSGPFMDRGGRNFDYKAFVEAVKMSEPAELE
ncbi:EF-hand [Acaromyces ingoldii]|uniref:EF-hand n=1 Tax=Acaromyces ingoldii TaxID=215250 RepID=A0A316YWA7_9BASI|nr:EF-hand [Acaromyces ingoldii]PWN93737.1 EF-hand [Acaromyces ingoldii]